MAKHYQKKFDLSLNTIKPHNVWRDQPFFKRAFNKYFKEVSGIQEIRCFFLQSALRSVHDVDGDVAECGTRNGKSALYMLEACERDRNFYLFDSFEGLSDPHPVKDTLKSAFVNDGAERMFATDVEKVKGRFSEFPNANIMQGWIPERFGEIADRRFCFVHIDVDLYEPTLDTLEFFYERTEPGGFIVCDDYGSGFFPGARDAMDEFFADKPEKPAELPQGQAFVVKR